MSFYRIEQAPCSVDPDRWFSEQKNNIKYCKAICSKCPFKVQCLAEAMEYEELSGERRWGIFGGLTAQERVKLRAKRGE